MNGKRPKRQVASYDSNFVSYIEGEAFITISLEEDMEAEGDGTVVFEHIIHLTDEEAKIFKDNNLTIVTCPCSNAKLASGIVPITKYYNMGINIAIGTDGPASNNGLDMFKEMYLLASFNRLQTQDEKFIPAFEFLKMATVNGAKAMGLNDADVLDVNKLADIIMIDLLIGERKSNYFIGG